MLTRVLVEITLTPYKTDFIGGSLDSLKESAVGGYSIQDITAISAIKGVGCIRLLVHTDMGAHRYIETQGYYVPQAMIHLLSICRYCKEYAGQRCSFMIGDARC